MTGEDERTDDNDDSGPLASVRRWLDEVVWFVVDLLFDVT
jgi:hypothetical protein